MLLSFVLMQRISPNPLLHQGEDLFLQNVISLSLILYVLMGGVTWNLLAYVQLNPVGTIMGATTTICKSNHCTSVTSTK